MDISEIELLYMNQLNKNLFVDSFLMNENISKLNEIGVPSLILNKFIPYTQNILSDVITFSKSNLSEIYLGIEMESNNVVCFSDKYNSYTFMNTDYESLIKTNYTYETFKKICVSVQTYGPYYDNTPSGGNFEKYAKVLEKLILRIDERSVKEGIWYSLIQEMELGVI